MRRRLPQKTPDQTSSKSSTNQPGRTRCTDWTRWRRRLSGRIMVEDCFDGGWE